MGVITKTIEKNLAIEQEKVSNIQIQLESINKKLDALIETVSNNHIENINRYNRLSERVTVLEASKEQTKYLITFVVVALTALEFLLKYVIR